MQRSTDRILTTHAGSLPRPADLREMVTAKSNGQPYDAAALAQRLRSAVAEVVQQELTSGLDSINDGELGKTNFTNYARERLSGFEERARTSGETSAVQLIFGRDLKVFPEYFAMRGSFAGAGQNPGFCTGPLTYQGQAALQDVEVVEAFLPAVAPGTIEHWLRNEYYPSDEAYLYAIADAMHEEYK